MALRKIGIALLGALAVLLVVAPFAFAQGPAAPPPDANSLLAALQAKQWILAAAAGSYLAVGLMKQGWLGQKIASLPAAAQPWIALAFSFVGMASLDIWHGTAWQLALVQCFEAAAVSVFFHQAAIEHLRGGREVIPSAPWMRAPVSGVPSMRPTAIPEAAPAGTTPATCAKVDPLAVVVPIESAKPATQDPDATKPPAA